MTTTETKEVNIFETHVIPPELEDDNVSLELIQFYQSYPCFR